ncbi:PadR family transcriptional regulator [Bryobacterales bacterium F-183]|nr:PadR family transcriptional regulator [Bryobacterales bacterium F-183]
MSNRLEVLPGTLELLVLSTVATMGPLHGYGIARRIEQLGGEGLLLNEGTVYAALIRLQQEGAISADWGVSENGRKARFYSITKQGNKRLTTATRDWDRTVSMVARILNAEAK